MKTSPERRILAGLSLLLCFCGWLPSAQAQTAPPADEAWGRGYLDAVLPELLEHAPACDMMAMTRFFDLLGGDYSLDLGGGSVEVIGRGTWGAGPVITEGRFWKPYPTGSSVCGWMNRITVHHTHKLFTIQSLQKAHQTQDDPKADIAYHFFIDSDGKIYEARPLGYVGSHAELDNTGNVGIVLNGDFQERRPLMAQLVSLRRLLRALHCPCSPLENIWTHQQRQSLNFPADPAHATACPGQELATEVYGLATELGIGPMTRMAPD